MTAHPMMPYPQLTQVPTVALASYLSSASAGWEELDVHAFHMALAVESYHTRATDHVALQCFTGGVMRHEWRSSHSAWQTQQLHHAQWRLSRSWDGATEWRWTTLSDAPLDLFQLLVSRDLLQRTAADLATGKGASLDVVDQVGFTDPLLMQIGTVLWSELTQPSPAGKLYAQTAAQFLAVHLLRHYTAGGRRIHEPDHGLTPQEVQRVVDYINAHLAQDLDLVILAQQVGFSPYHFARMFRQTTGDSPHQYVLRQRVANAQRQLTASTAPLVQVALESGFGNQSHFTHTFKRLVGVTPLAYRRQSRAS